MRHVTRSLCLAVCASIAAVQGAASQPIDHWRGNAGWEPLSSAQLNEGERTVGDVVVDVELTRSRTGRIASDVVLVSDEHGALTIPADTIVVANRQTYLMVGGGEPARNFDGGIEWCTVAVTQSICIERSLNLRRLSDPQATERSPRFTYTEYAAPARLSGRVWSGEAPAIREERMEFETPLRKQLIVREIDRRGVLLTLRTIRNGETTDVPVQAQVQYGTRVYDSRTFVGVAFQFRREGRNRVSVEPVEVPAE